MSKKQQRRPAARPDEILDAALALFTANGFAATRMDDIAKQAGITKGAVYLYFSSKEQLFEALITRFSESFVAEAAKRFKGISHINPEEALRSAVYLIITMASDKKMSAAPRLVLAEGARFPEMAALYHQKVISIGQQVIGLVMEEGHKKGVFKKTTSDVAVRMVMGPCMAHMLLTHVFSVPLSEGTSDPAVLAKNIVDILLYGIGTNNQEKIS